MQTFLPFPDFQKSAESLDVKRLGKQRVETLQILRANLGINKGWYNAPATRMWRGCERMLTLYGVVICKHWISLGYRDSVLIQLTPYLDHPNDKVPFWFGDEAFHRSHRSNLIRKFPQWYQQNLGWRDPNNIPYVWPV